MQIAEGVLKEVKIFHIDKKEGVLIATNGCVGAIDSVVMENIPKVRWSIRWVLITATFG